MPPVPARPGCETDAEPTRSADPHAELLSGLRLSCQWSFEQCDAEGVEISSTDLTETAPSVVAAKCGIRFGAIEAQPVRACHRRLLRCPFEEMASKVSPGMVAIDHQPVDITGECVLVSPDRWIRPHQPHRRHHRTIRCVACDDELTSIDLFPDSRERNLPRRPLVDSSSSQPVFGSMAYPEDRCGVTVMRWAYVYHSQALHRFR